MKLVVLAALAAFVLVGCAGLGGVGSSFQGLSAEQINAAVKDKSSAAACLKFTGTGGQIETMIVNQDKTYGTGGGRTIMECGSAKVTFEDAGKAATVARVPEATPPKP
jgi:hypothetical protein